MNLRSTVFVSFFTILTLPAAAHAGSKKARVRAHKAAAFRLFDQGKFAEGIEKMEEAYGLIPHPGFLLNIAVAYDRWGEGHCEESLETFDRFFLECDGCKLQASAEEEHRRVKTDCQVPIDFRSTPEGASVAVDGTVRGRTPLTLRLLPGRYSIILDKTEHQRHSRPLVVTKAQPAVLEATLEPKRSAPPPSTPFPPITAQSSRPSSGPSPMTWAAFGVGAAGLATGIAFTVLTRQKLADEEAARQTPLPKADIEALQDDARTNAIVAHVGYGVAAAGVVTGLVLLLVTGGEETPATSVAIGPGSVGIAGRF